MSNRDFVMARLAVVQSSLSDMRDDAHQVVELFIDPEEDEDGKQRVEVLDGLELGCHSVLQAVQAAREATEGMPVDELRQPEEDYDDGAVDYEGDEGGGDPEGEPQTEPPITA